MFVGFLAEPALLMVLFTASLISGSTSLPSIVDTLAHRELASYPSLAFSGGAFTMVSRAEHARHPGDKPATPHQHTMIHAAMDIGTQFGSLGARREMFIGFLSEPALLMVLFTASLISGSTSLPTIVDTLAHRELAIYPSLAFAGVAFTMVSLAENARIPIDNPSTHLELTMIHEAMILEYSARHLALLEWASALKLFNYSCIGLALFLPFGIAEGASSLAMLAAAPALVAKLAVGGAALALIETLSAKLRLFRAPEFLGTAILLAVLGMLVNLLLGS
jgi:formate hydrogenlyase subunit 4